MDRLLSESSRYFGEKRPAWLAPGALQGIEWCAGAPTAHRGNPIRSPAKWLRSRVVSPLFNAARLLCLRHRSHRFPRSPSSRRRRGQPNETVRCDAADGCGCIVHGSLLLLAARLGSAIPAMVRAIPTHQL